MFIDSHAHLYYESFDNDRDALIEDLLRNQEILNIINISANLESGAKCIELAEKYKELYATSGIHPSDLIGIKDDDLKIIRERLQHPKVVGIGEVGLDYYHKQVDPKIQKYFFVKQLEIALEEDYPLVIHCREADDDILKIIKEVNNKYKGVFHCYAGSLEMAEELIGMGFYISFTGNITFKKSDRPAVIEKLPLSKMLIETDSPFLTPTPFRGKRNNPGFVRYVAEKIAEIKNIDISEVAKVTTKNTQNLFGV